MWRRRGVGWPTPNPGAAFSSDVSGFDYPGAEGERFTYRLCDWVGGTPRELDERRKRFEIEERDMSKKPAKKSSKQKKAPKKVAPKKPSKAKQAFNERMKTAMSVETPAEMVTRVATAPDPDATKAQKVVVNVEFRVANGPHPVHNDLEREDLLKRLDKNHTMTSDDISALIKHLKFAHERLKVIDNERDEVEKQIKSEHETAMEKLAAEAGEEIETAVAEARKSGEEKGQNEALKEIAEMFGCPTEDPEAAFDFLKKTAAWVGTQRGSEAPHAKLAEAEAARDVAAEQCKVAERQLESALLAVKLNREDADKARKERAQAEMERDSALTRTEAALAAEKAARRALADAEKALVEKAPAANGKSKKNGIDEAAVQDQTLKEIAGMFGGQCATAEEAFTFLSQKAAG